MRIILTSVVVATALGLGGCDYVPEFLRPIVSPTITAKDVSKGAYTGQLKVMFLEPKTPDDRSVQILEPFGYQDTKGVAWEVPAGFVSDGASIPWGLWSFIGGPFDGPYREAAVLHDYYCSKRDRTWEEVHGMFLEAALRRGVSESTAQTMYAGILYGGPRWELGTALKKAQVVPGGTPAKPPVDPGITKRDPTAQEKQMFEDLRLWIQKEKPTPDQIRKKIEELRAKQGLPTK